MEDKARSPAIDLFGGHDGVPETLLSPPFHAMGPLVGIAAFEVLAAM